MNPEAQYNLRHLAQFLAIARTGSLAAASEQVGISPPALSKRVADLESRIGVRLFERVGRGLHLTAQGTEFKRDVERLLGHAADISKRLDERAQGSRGSIRIGCGPAALQGPVSRVLGTILAEAASVSIEIVSGNTVTLLRALDDYQLDFILSDASAMPADTTEDYVALPLEGEPMALAARLDHELFQRKQLSLSDILAYPWVTPSVPLPMRARLSSLLGSEAVSDWGRRRVQAVPDVQIENLSACMQVAMRTDAITAVLQREVDDGLMFPGLGIIPFELGIATNIWLVHLRNRTATGLAQRTMNALLGLEDTAPSHDTSVTGRKKRASAPLADDETDTPL
ncbi:MAG: LysR family transcriptional regulator [Pseudomonadales bacterium]|nr:LysR family transcriptional regulator [Pseudomonadales bacterium]